jgi:hypothetical protein
LLRTSLWIGPSDPVLLIRDKSPTSPTLAILYHRKPDEAKPPS